MDSRFTRRKLEYERLVPVLIPTQDTPFTEQHRQVVDR